jgi:hypothetical protein
LTITEKQEAIRLVRATMGEGHPTGERIVSYVRDGHTNLARNALRESIEGLEALIEMDEDGVDDMSEDTPEETKAEDQSDLDKYKMLLEALGEN